MVELHTADEPSLRRAAEVLGALGSTLGLGLGFGDPAVDVGMGEPAVDVATRRCSISAPAGVKLLPAVVRALDEAGVEVADIALRRPTLDEVFLALTGRATKEEAA